MKRLNILLVEDEILIAEMVADFLKEKGHNVLGIAISYDEALKEFNLRKPDLVLLDIKLYGEKSGIDLANYLRSAEEDTPIIYLSSQYDEHTLSYAMNTNPYGYLTKPIRKESLWTSIEAAYKLYESRKQKSPKIKLFDGKNYHLVYNEEIVFLEADHVYVNIHLENDKKLVIRNSLKEIKQLLDDNIMIQCHRSFIINKNQIKSKNQDYITLINDKKIPISRSKRKLLNSVVTSIL